MYGVGWIILTDDDDATPQLRKQERTKLKKMNRMQPSKRTGKNVRKWCLKKIKLFPQKRSLQNLHETMKYIYEVDELMYFRLRRMLDGA